MKSTAAFLLLSYPSTNAAFLAPRSLSLHVSQQQVQLNWRAPKDFIPLKESQHDHDAEGFMSQNKQQKHQEVNATSTSTTNLIPPTATTATSETVQKISDKAKKTLDKIFNKNFGHRGEIYLVFQVILLYCITIGHVPLLKDFIYTLFGPTIFFLGAIMTFMSVREMNTAFTAFSTPVSKRKGGKLVTDGLFAYIRHPVYAGNLCCFIGISIMTGSSMRLFLTGAYWLLVEMKTRKEEEELVEVFGLEYGEYCKRVPDKFIPVRALQRFGREKVRKGEMESNGKEQTTPRKLDILLNGDSSSEPAAQSAVKPKPRNNKGLFP